MKASDLCSLLVDTSLDQRRAGERRRRGKRREREKKRRTSKRGKTAHVALLSSSRSCLILVLVLLFSSWAVPRRRSSPLDAVVMYSMARHSTIMRGTTRASVYEWTRNNRLRHFVSSSRNSDLPRSYYKTPHIFPIAQTYVDVSRNKTSLYFSFSLLSYSRSYSRTKRERERI